MASGAAGTTRVTEPAGPPVVAEVAGEQVIDQQLRRARRQVKLIDMATRALIGVVGLVAYLLLVVWSSCQLAPPAAADQAILLLGVPHVSKL